MMLTEGEGVKRCSRCKVTKVVAAFCKNASKKDGLHHYCRECKAVGAAEYYAANRDALVARFSDPTARAGGLISNANKSARRREVAELDWAQELPKITVAIENGFYGVPYDLETGRGRAVKVPMTPSISRIDNTNPCYVDNYVIEPWALNAFRSSGTHEQVVALVDALEAAHPDGIAGFLRFPHSKRPPS